MALVHDDQVEEVGYEVAVYAVGVPSIGEGLIDPEVDLATGLRFALELPDRTVTEGGDELARHRVVDQDVAIGEIEDAWLAVTAPVAGPEFPDDLKRDEGLAGARGHRQQQPLVAGQDRLDGAVDRDPLVVARLLHAAVEGA